MSDPQYPAGIFEHIVLDHSENQVNVHSQQDVEPILEHNKRLYNEACTGNRGYSPSRTMVRVATIPNILIHKWLQEGINVYDLNDWPKILAKLDDPEYALLRTAPGRLSGRPIRQFFPPKSRGKRNALQLL